MYLAPIARCLYYNHKQAHHKSVRCIRLSLVPFLVYSCVRNLRKPKTGYRGKECRKQRSKQEQSHTQNIKFTSCYVHIRYNCLTIYMKNTNCIRDALHYNICQNTFTKKLPMEHNSGGRGAAPSLSNPLHNLVSSIMILSTS